MPREFNGEKVVFSTYGAETTVYLYANRIQLDPYLIPYKNYSKLIKVLNKQAKTIKLLEA